MEQTLLKDLLSRFSKYAFQSFTLEMLRAGYGEAFITPRPELGEGVYVRYPWDEYYLNGVYITHYIPFELFRNPSNIEVGEPEIIRALEGIRRFGESNPIWAIHFFLNSANYPLPEDRVLIPKYDLLVKEMEIKFAEGQRRLAFGNLDSFIEQMPDATESGLKTFLKSNNDGLCISLSPDHASVNRFSIEKPVFSGVSRHGLNPYEPTFIHDESHKENVLREFENLIINNAEESQLEEFLVSYYKEIFGAQYDRIETQLWLRFPDLDIAGRDRRIDLFLRNTVIDDWELFEVKRATRLTRDYRDMPVIAAEVFYAMQQVRNYSRILSQDIVKRKFADEGIEYYEPALHLVIGRNPQLSQQQWRRLVVENAKDLKLITFDELLKEMKLRLEDRYLIS